ncbi:hypothetical protein L798_06313 [Zootermopsis nevadensis]|uniref:Uncharacterized protein n=1 Tax=Zootermopsis nevadensis TaxID=136037 RepID=A0A067RKB4_ZOONE|nr:hypothetical protein L798_06313 [Zootermopsis nevadensis]
MHDELEEAAKELKLKQQQELKKLTQLKVQKKNGYKHWAHQERNRNILFLSKGDVSW